MKQFEIPTFYRSPIISQIKHLRKEADPRKKDYSPTLLDFGPVRILLARHFGFCYGVENAIEISYRAIEQNPGKRIFLLSEMIHNPEVNGDLLSRGVKFIMDTHGNQWVQWEELTAEDIIIIPAFGTTLEIFSFLEEIGVEVQAWDTTCPFVEKVWKRAESLGNEDYTVIVHGKPKHEETRATFSHSASNAPTLVLRDMEDAKILIEYILNKRDLATFKEVFSGKYTEGFDPIRDLDRMGVVNQTTMLASETQAIADAIKAAFIEKYGEEGAKSHFADTRDTLCYATNDNQRATFGLLEAGADLAIVVGGYNSSNTSHLVELCEQQFPTYFISGAAKLQSPQTIHHFDLHTHTEITTTDYLPQKPVTDIIVTSGASCPDIIVEEVIQKLLTYYPSHHPIEQVLATLNP